MISKELPIEDFMPQIQSDISALSAYNLGHRQAQEEWRAEKKDLLATIAELRSKLEQAPKRAHGQIMFINCPAPNTKEN